MFKKERWGGKNSGAVDFKKSTKQIKRKNDRVICPSFAIYLEKKDELDILWAHKERTI